MNAAQRAYQNGGDSIELPCDMQLRECSSWLNTYLTDPPTKSAQIHLSVECGKVKSNRASAQYTVKTSNSQGLTLGDIVGTSVPTKHHWAGRLNAGSESAGERSVGDVVKRLGATDRNPAYLTKGITMFRLNGVVLPSEEERESLN